MTERQPTDSTGRPLRVGDRVRWRGECYVVAGFGPGALEMRLAGLAGNPTADEMSVDLVESPEEEVRLLQEIVSGLTDRVAAQSELLTRHAGCARAIATLEGRVLDLRGACQAALPALERAAQELGGSGYFAAKADALRDALKGGPS